MDDRSLISFITPVWNTPVPFLRDLADSILAQAEQQPLEWVVLDNGSTVPELIDFLDRDLSTREHVSFFRSARNLGIIGGTRFCLERSSRRYVLPVDHDDRLYPDAASIMAQAICASDYPPLLYSDEDKLVDGEPALPFFKPDWDPVLFLDQCYTAHLCAIDRRLALALGAYNDADCEGSPDWDCFMRFVIAGHRPVHVPEVIYSWRMHEQSTAQNINSKSYIHSSQQAVLGRFLTSMPHAERFSLELSPLFNGTPDWWLRRKHTDPWPVVVVSLTRADPAQQQRRPPSGEYPVAAYSMLPISAKPAEINSVLPTGVDDNALVCLVSSDLDVLDPEWAWEALGIFETHPDAVVAGGRCIDAQDRIVEAGQHFGMGEGCDSPDVGRAAGDPGYSVWLWKRHSVSAVSSGFSVFRAGFLREFLLQGCPSPASIPFLGAWAGAYAAQTGRRIVYSPFLFGRLRRPWSSLVSAEERRAFLMINRDIVPDTRFYSSRLGLELATNYRPVSPAERAAHLDHLLQLNVRPT